MVDNIVWRGDVYIVDFGEANKHKGSVQGGTRAAIVVSNETMCKYSPIQRVVPLTSKDKKKLPIHKELDIYKYNFLYRTNNIALCEQEQPVDMKNMLKYLGHLDKEDLDEIISLVKENF